MKLSDNPYYEDGVLEDNGNIGTDNWLQSIMIRTAEWYMRGQLTAFEKMEMAQGSLIPYFYGTHKASFLFMAIADTIHLQCLVPTGQPSRSFWHIDGVCRCTTVESRRQKVVGRAPGPVGMSCVHITDDSMTPYSIPQVTSIRHGLRVIQCADISQHDWHPGQILCNLTLSSQAHAVLIDFSATTQTLDLDVDLSLDDYGHCVSAISFPEITGLDVKWVCEYWDRDEMKRESWDTNRMGLREGEYIWSSYGVDPYKFVYDELD